MKVDIESKKFKELLVKSLLDSKLEISKFQNELKEKYKNAWGGSEYLDKRLAKEYTRIIVDHMIDIMQEEEFEQVKEGSD